MVLDRPPEEPCGAHIVAALEARQRRSALGRVLEDESRAGAAKGVEGIDETPMFPVGRGEQRIVQAAVAHIQHQVDKLSQRLAVGSGHRHADELARRHIALDLVRLHRKRDQRRDQHERRQEKEWIAHSGGPSLTVYGGG
jgi:hypothetical protein